MRRAGAGNSRCRSLRSLVLQEISMFARNKVNASIVKSFAQAFSKACGFQRRSLWRVFKGGALNIHFLIKTNGSIFTLPFVFYIVLFFDLLN